MLRSYLRVIPLIGTAIGVGHSRTVQPRHRL